MMAEAVTSTLELESYLIGEHKEPSEGAIAFTHPNLVTMLSVLMERIAQLEYDVKERQVADNIRKQYHQLRQKKRKHRGVICHKCKQQGHFVSRFANIPPREIHR